jgi:hypothetical protein
MNWTVTNNYNQANHEQVIEINGPKEIYIKPGDKIQLKAFVKDPDGDAYTIKWWQFKKSATTPILQITNVHTLNATIEVPSNISSKESLEVVVEVTDKGKTPLTRYQVVKCNLF